MVVNYLAVAPLTTNTQDKGFPNKISSAYILKGLSTSIQISNRMMRSGLNNGHAKSGGQYVHSPLK